MGKEVVDIRQLPCEVQWEIQRVRARRFAMCLNRNILNKKAKTLIRLVLSPKQLNGRA